MRVLGLMLLLGLAFAGLSGCATAPRETRLAHISILERGAGPPVVLIPGNATPRAVWDGVAPELGRSHRLILVQLNGYGGDDPGANTEPGVLAGVVNETAAYLQDRQISNAAFIGHSMGGLLSLMIAEQHPELVSKVLLVDSRLALRLALFPDLPDSEIPRRAEQFREAALAQAGHPEAQRAAAIAQAQRTALTPDAQSLVMEWNLAADARVMAQVGYEALMTDFRPRLPNVHAPLVLLYPWQGAVAEQAASEAMYRNAYANAPAVTYIGVANARHYLMLDQPERFAEEVRRFLQ